MKGNLDPLVPGVHLKVPHKLQVYLSKCDLFSGHQALKGLLFPQYFVILKMQDFNTSSSKRFFNKFQVLFQESNEQANQNAFIEFLFRLFRVVG